MSNQIEGLARIAAAFVRHNVKFVAIGGWAVQAQGYDLGYETEDIDFTPDLAENNLARIVEALEDLGAKTINAEGEAVEFLPGAAVLGRARFWNLTCEHGDFDLVLQPSGLDYRQLSHSAHTVPVEVDGAQIVVPCADLADIVISKGFSQREKDQRSLPRLQAQLNEIHGPRRRGRAPGFGRDL